jgi:phage internal scaffolding protein
MAQFRKAYDGKRVRVTKFIDPVTLTKQSFKDRCDINQIVGRFQKTGLVDHVARFNGDYADLVDVPDYHDAMNKIIAANECFISLPSSLRKRFNNDPGEFLDFVGNPDNRDEMVELGLCEPIAPGAVPASPESASAQPEAGSSEPTSGPTNGGE